MFTIQLSLENQHILIADANPSNLLLIELLLQEHTIHYIHKALSAQEVYNTLKTEPIDAILMDVMMPDIDGIQICQTIRNDPLYDAIPIIMVTAADDNDTFKRSFHAGADDFVPKPINDVVLISRLKSQLEKRQMYQTLIEQSRFSAMDEVISMLAHQWRQPLGVINAITNNVRIKMELESVQERDITDAFEKIEQNLDELSDMINQFKNSFASSQSKECCSLSYKIDEMLKLNQETINEFHISVQKEIEDIGSFVLAKQAFIQVLIHLLKNCFDSFNRFPVKEPKIQISLKKVNNLATLCISDNGAGISEANLPHIFEPYFSTKTEKNGKGLGLYFAKHLVEKQLEGELTLSSQKGLTTATFSVALQASC